MKDTIYREDAIEILNKRSEELKGIYGDLGGAAKGASKLIEILPSAQQWIPVSEGVPENPPTMFDIQEYLVCKDFGGEQIIAWCDGWNCTMNINGVIDRTSEIKDVVAWMPLPKPYRGNKSIVVKKLKPCPFCGGTVKLQRDDHVEGDTTYTITCFNCYVDMGEYKTVEEIREAWNRRVES